jgi:hypothetical protein
VIAGIEAALAEVGLPRDYGTNEKTAKFDFVGEGL